MKLIFAVTIFLASIISDSPYVATDVTIMNCSPGEGASVSFYTPDLEAEGGIWLTWRYATEDGLRDTGNSAPALGDFTVILTATPPDHTLLAVEWRATEQAELILASCQYGVIGIGPIEADEQ